MQDYQRNGWLALATALVAVGVALAAVVVWVIGLLIILAIIYNVPERLRTLRRPSGKARHRLIAGERLSAGESLYSQNRRFELAMQHDGNLVLYCQDRPPITATGTDRTGDANYLKMQEDGNLVLYTNEDIPLRATNTMGSRARRLVLKNNGNLVLCTRLRRILIRHAWPS